VRFSRARANTHNSARKLDEHVAIVAGASGGIGAATVRALLAARFSVVLAAPQDALLDAAAREFAPFGNRALIVPTDITVRAEVDALVARALVAFGRVDVLANVAGIGSSPSLCDCTDDELERVLAVNLLGAARLMHAVLPVMKAQRRGAIVNVGSVAGEAGVMGIYSASKFGLRGLSDSVRREVRSFNVGVTLVEPGFVRTPMNPSMRDLPGPEIVADAIVAAAARPRRVHVVPASYRVPVFLMKTFPALADLVFGSARIQQRLNRDARAERAARAAVTP
jgi:NAD(P)-dependent dehydrogenase (short-subunit alcohol dehydrogenase family)